MPKILFLIPTLMHGGAEKVLVNLVNNLDPTKYDVTLYSIFDEGVNKQFLKSHVKYRSRFKKVFRGNSQIMKLFSPRFLYRFLIKDDYDIVVSFLEGPAARIISGCTNRGTKKVAWIHSDTLTHDLASVGFRNFAEARDCYEKFNHVIGVSQNVMDSFKKNVTDQVAVSVLYNVIETEEIKAKGAEVADDYFSENVIRICSAGKLTKNKGFDRLLEAHHALVQEGFPHQVNILGIGEGRDQLEKRIVELGVERSFRLLGFHQNPYPYISKSDLYVCASHREGFSTAVTEALILGIPVVSTSVSGAEELLGQEQEFGIVTENSTEGIYRGIKQMLSDPEQLAYYRKQAAIRGNHFSKAHTVKAAEFFFDAQL